MAEASTVATNDVQISQIPDNSNIVAVKLCPKRKLTESLSPEKAKIYQNLMQSHSPDNSIVIYSDHKKRVYESLPGEVNHADNDQVNEVNDPIKDGNTESPASVIKSDSYDSEDNRPLSQLTTQMSTDQRTTTADENNLVYTPQLERKRAPALHTRLLRARSRGQGRPDRGARTSNSELEVDLPKPTKRTINLAETLKKIETSIANLTIQKEQTQSEIAQINENVAKLAANIVSREELTNAISRKDMPARK